MTSGAKALKAAASSARLKSCPDTKHFPLGLKPARMKAGLDVRADARCCELARTFQAVAFEVQAEACTLQAVSLREGVFLDQFQGLLNVSLILRRVNSMDKPNGRLVLVSYTHYCASTSSLSTRWSSWTLLDPFGLGDLILGRASRLYAFSGYHNRTSLPSRAFGKTTGTQEVRPSRSSRTKDSPPQISYAHSR